VSKPATGVSILRPGNYPSKKLAPSAKPQRKRDGHDTGAALRSVYQQTVAEAIPAEMLDLLDKLS
jgi:hypothetical protein